jgi:hypothetical protein
VLARHLLLAVAVLAAAAGCATFRDSQTVCPEYRDLRCLTAPECSLDRDRGCQVCRCSPAAASPEQGSLPSAVPPDRRTQ